MHIYHVISSNNNYFVVNHSTNMASIQYYCVASSTYTSSNDVIGIYDVVIPSVVVSVTKAVNLHIDTANSAIASLTLAVTGASNNITLRQHNNVGETLSVNIANSDEATVSLTDSVYSKSVTMGVTATDSLVAVNRTYMGSFKSTGSYLTGSSLLIDQSTIENKLTSVQKAFDNVATFTAALLEVRRSRILTVERHAMYFAAHVQAGGVHRFIDNEIKTTYTTTFHQVTSQGSQQSAITTATTSTPAPCLRCRETTLLLAPRVRSLYSFIKGAAALYTMVQATTQRVPCISTTSSAQTTTISLWVGPLA
jgi:hypothetical protein